jgi:hypothetical protein
MCRGTTSFLFYSFFIELILIIQPVFRLCPEALKLASIDSVINDFFVINERMPDADDVEEMLVAVNGSRSTDEPCLFSRSDGY